MSDMRAMVERNIGFSRGASFLEKDNVIMFQYVNDSSSVVGPRKATKADREQFPAEWDAFNKGRLPQLDHDKDGYPGGSVAKTAEPEVSSVEALEEAQEAPKRRGRPPKAKE